jgi:sulfite reductase subunit B
MIKVKPQIQNHPGRPVPPKGDVYLPQAATIVKKQPMTALDCFFEFKMDSGKELGHQPGQFVEISVAGWGEAPISISSSPTHKGVFQMVIRKVGSVTTALHDLKVGDKVGIRGPYGTVFPVATDLKGKAVLFIAGGIGLVPLRSAINYCLDNRKDYGDISILFGARTPDDRLFVDELEAWRLRKDLTFIETVDQGRGSWKGNVGLITTLIPKVCLNTEHTATVICGPPVMYKFVIKELMKMHVPHRSIYVSLERRMKCGVGKCGHCQMNGVYVCQEGPVFKQEDILDVQEAI